MSRRIIGSEAFGARPHVIIRHGRARRSWLTPLALHLVFGAIGVGAGLYDVHSDNAWPFGLTVAVIAWIIVRIRSR